MFILCIGPLNRLQVCVFLGEIARPLDIPARAFDSDAQSRLTVAFLSWSRLTHE